VNSYENTCSKLKLYGPPCVSALYRIELLSHEQSNNHEPLRQ